MASRSRLKVGLDVPWVTSWSDEALIGVRPCPSASGQLAVCQAERPGFGRPEYSRNHMSRQRWSVGRMLCPMCGEPTRDGDRWSQTARQVSVGALRAKGLGGLAPADLPDARLVLDAGAIAPLHLVCAQRSMLHCPHLQMHAAPEPIAFPKRWVVLPLMVEAKPQPAHVLLAAPAPARSIPVVGFLQLCGLLD
jgi:hypothetical protein